MEYRILGRTNIEVSEIGFGGWGIGGGGMWQQTDDAESMRALHRAADLGVNFYDTALVYGNGHSERLIGKFFKERKERFTVATKIPPINGKWPAREGSKLSEVFTYDHIIQCTEQSLRNLNIDSVDLQQFHVWNDDWTNEKEWSDAIAKLKEQGKIRFVGISINDRQPENALKVAATGLIDTFQVIYNIFEQTPEEKLFPYCRKHNIGILARVPLDEGGLTGLLTPGTTFSPGDFREYYFREGRLKKTVERVEKLKAMLRNEAAYLPELALRFCLQHPAVSTVIPGMRKVSNVEKNCVLSDGARLKDTVVAELRKHAWRRTWKD
jgi:aryl-alcohol dehydrogenase-like predicted oxidoreductase